VPPVNLKVDWERCESNTLRMQGLLPSLSAIVPAHRKFIAEIMMIRLFLLLENTILSSAAKILCGATYLDGLTPKPLVSVRSIPLALDAMRNNGRTKPKPNLPWNKSTEIRDNLSNTLDPADPFFGTIIKHGSLLTEMRFVRNHIAHNNPGTRANFQKVIRQYYGGPKKGVTPGIILLTTAFSPRCVLEKYIVSTRVFVKELLRN
jgi:hypothetical protein